MLLLVAVSAVTRDAADVTRREAAVRGAAGAAVWAALLLAFLWGSQLVRGKANSDAIGSIAEALFQRKLAGPAHVVIASIAAAAVVGALLSRAAARLDLNRWGRVTLLACLALPGLYLVVAVALFLIWTPQVFLTEPYDWPGLALMPISALMYAGYGMVLFAPVGAVPAVAAAITIERLVPREPKSEHREDVPRPRVRGRLAWVLLALGSALATFVLLRLLRRG